MRSFVLSFLVLIVLSCHGQELKISEIMKGEEFVGALPDNLRILPNDQVVFTWKRDTDEARSYYTLKNNEPYLLSDKELNILPLEGYVWSADKKFAVYARKGNLFIWNVSQPLPNSLIISSDYISNVGLSNQDQWVYFTCDNNLRYIDLKSHSVKQLTNFITSSAPSKSEKDFLERQQFELFNFIKDQEKEHPSSSLLPAPIYIGSDQIQQLQLSPDGTLISYVLEQVVDSERTKVQHHITDNGYTQIANARPKVGRMENKYSFYLFSVEDGKTNQFDFEQLSNLNKAPEFYKEYGKTDYLNKGVVFHGPYYNSKGNRAVLEIKSLDNKNRWIVELDLKELNFSEVVYERDEAWIGGPGISGWNEVPGTLGWLGENEFYFQSEETGYSHLYAFDLVIRKKRALTNGKYEVHEVIKGKTSEQLYVLTNQLHPGSRNCYLLNTKTANVQPVLVDPGKYEVVFSRDFGRVYSLYSYKNKPTELYVSENSLKSKPKQLTFSLTSDFKSYPWYDPEIVTIKAKDGKYIYARLYEPEESLKNGAGVIFVHGAGYLQNAHNYWSLYYREYMFHNLLRDQGYTILDIDYRASEGYGRDWRTGIYRHMGGLDLSDQMDGREYLIAKCGVKEERIGIYGGSYGGFITLMALLTEPGKFKCGAALRSVTDWAHYNHEYTSNILNTPEEDSIAFRQSSPIYFAENLKDPLLMLHGMVDDNVQFQDVVRLSQRFIELGKENWEMAVYPVEPHGFKTATSWTDEYTRIYKLFETHLRP